MRKMLAPPIPRSLSRTPSRRNNPQQRGGFGRPAPVSRSISIQKPGHRAGLSHVEN
jgi:hypothetical protein